MRRLLYAGMFVLALVCVAVTQTGTVKTPAQLIAEINTLLADNTFNAITPFDMRQILLDMVASSGSALRTPYTGNFTFYADFLAGSDTNTCTAAGAGNACKTIQGAYNNLVKNYDTRGFATFISFNNTDTQGLVVGITWTGGGQLVIKGPGNGTTAPTIGIDTTASGQPAINIGAPLPAILVLQDLYLAGQYGIEMLSPGQVQVRGPVNFGPVTQSHMFVNDTGASIFCYNEIGSGGGIGYTISGGGVAHYNASAGTIVCANLTVTLTGTPAFTVFAQVANSGGALLAPSMTYSGAATGQRYSVLINGSINIGLSANCAPASTYFPGSTNGACLSGGQYQ